MNHWTSIFIRLACALQTAQIRPGLSKIHPRLCLGSPRALLHWIDEGQLQTKEPAKTPRPNSKKHDSPPTARRSGRLSLATGWQTPPSQYCRSPCRHGELCGEMLRNGPARGQSTIRQTHRRSKAATRAGADSTGKGRVVGGGCGACLARTEASGRARHTKEWAGEMFSMLALNSHGVPACTWGVWGVKGVGLRSVDQISTHTHHTHITSFLIYVLRHQLQVRWEQIDDNCRRWSSCLLPDWDINTNNVLRKHHGTLQQNRRTPGEDRCLGKSQAGWEWGSGKKDLEKGAKWVRRLPGEDRSLRKSQAFQGMGWGNVQHVGIEKPLRARTHMGLVGRGGGYAAWTSPAHTRTILRS